MKNICMNIQEQIVSGLKMTSPEDQVHLKNCPDCALFLAMMEFTKEEGNGAEEFTVPEKLDRIVLETAHKRIEHRSLRIWKIALPIAASFLFCAGLIFYAVPGPEKTPVTRATVQKPVPQKDSGSWNNDFEEKLFKFSCDVGSGISSMSGTLDLI